jgi:hypothetical protein
VPNNHDDLVSFARFRAPDGALVVEAELADGHRYAVEFLIERARTLGADKLWVHAEVMDANIGFERRGSYARLEATAPPAAIELAFPPLDRIAELRRACFGDLWGHHEAGPPDIDSVFVALHERGAWVGICEVDPEAQWIDGPGVVPALRTPDRYARLVRGAAAFLQKEPVVLESWGDAASTLAAYVSLGFRIVRSVPGWELDLRAP